MSTKTLLTAEQFARLPATDMRQELDEGELIEMPPNQEEHGLMEAAISLHLNAFVSQHRLGQCFHNVGFLLSRDPDVVRAPDISFLTAERLRGPLSGTYREGAPDLAIEIVSPSDIAPDLLRKVRQYLAAGAQSVWVIYPEEREAQVFDRSGQFRIVVPGAELTHPELLPGFKLPLNELFE